MEINGKKRGEQKTKEWGLVAWVLSEYVMTMYAIAGPLARCFIVGQTVERQGACGDCIIAVPSCQGK